MSLMVGEPFFSLPQALVRGGVLPKLTGSAAKLYLAVMHEVERDSNRAPTITTTELCALTGVSPNTVRSGMKQLVALKLMEVSLWGPDGLLLNVLSATDGQPYDADPRKPSKFQKRAASLTMIKRPLSKRDLAGVAFPFGANDERTMSANTSVTDTHTRKLTERMSERNIQQENGPPIYDFGFPVAKS